MQYKTRHSVQFDIDERQRCSSLTGSVAYNKHYHPLYKDCVSYIQPYDYLQILNCCVGSTQLNKKLMRQTFNGLGSALTAVRNVVEQDANAHYNLSFGQVVFTFRMITSDVN